MEAHLWDIFGDLEDDSLEAIIACFSRLADDAQRRGWTTRQKHYTALQLGAMVVLGSRGRPKPA